MARQLSDEDILKYKDKPATKKQIAYADWLIDKLEIEFPNNKAEASFREAVRIADALRMPFQASPENQASLAEAKAARAEEESKPKAAKGKKSKDSDEEEAPAKPAKGKAAKATKAKPAPDPEDTDDDEPVAPAPKKSSPRKASARSGAAAPF